MHVEALRAFSAGSPLQEGGLGPLSRRPLVLSLCRLAWAPHIGTAMDWLVSTELWLSLFTLTVSGDRVPMRFAARCGGRTAERVGLMIAAAAIAVGFSRCFVGHISGVIAKHPALRMAPRCPLWM